MECVNCGKFSILVRAAILDEKLCVFQRRFFRVRSVFLGKTLFANIFIMRVIRFPYFGKCFDPFLDYFGLFVRKLSDLGVLAGLMVCMDSFWGAVTPEFLQASRLQPCWVLCL